MEPPCRLLERIPSSVGRWLGYRSSPPLKPLSPWGVAFWSFVAAFGGISVIQATFHASYFVRRAVPPVIGSFGASAVLIYGSIDSPLAQPRALFGGHFIGALIGTSISKLFLLLPPERYDDLQWLAGSLAVSVALVAMQFTKTVHPPAGATALLAATNQQVIDLSWYLLPVVLLSSTLALVIALLINNLQRRYPLFWLTPDVRVPVKPQGGHDGGKGGCENCASNF